MIGRTHGVHAEPMTFGLKLALWYAEIGRDVERVAARPRRSSASASCRARSARSRICRRRSKPTSAGASGLAPAPVASQVIQRDRHAELLAALAITAASLEKFALEIRGLQKTEIGEVEEPFAKGQKGSSAMPHKRNPIGCEQIVGLARLIRGNCHAAFENIALWHERDISHSSVERVILPDSFIALDHMLRRFTRIVTGMVVYPERMRENLESIARRGLFRNGAAGAGAQGRLARAGLRMGAAQRDALVRRAARLQGAAARRRGRRRACCPRPRSSGRSISTSSSARRRLRRVCSTRESLLTATLAARSRVR